MVPCPLRLNRERCDGTKNKMKGLLQLQSKKGRIMCSLGFGTVVYFFYLLNSVFLNLEHEHYIQTFSFKYDHPHT